MNDQMRLKLDAIFRSIFHLPEENLSSTSFALCLGRHPWDSLKHIELLNAVEKEFGIVIGSFEAANFKNRKSIEDELSRRL